MYQGTLAIEALVLVLVLASWCDVASHDRSESPSLCLSAVPTAARGRLSDAVDKVKSTSAGFSTPVEFRESNGEARVKRTQLLHTQQWCLAARHRHGPSVPTAHVLHRAAMLKGEQGWGAHGIDLRDPAM